MPTVTTGSPGCQSCRALSNAGLWFLGRLQTDADRARVLDGLAASAGVDGTASAQLQKTLQQLAPRWFLIRNAHTEGAPLLLKPRYAMSLMRGPMTRVEIQKAREIGAGRGALEEPESTAVA